MSTLKLTPEEEAMLAGDHGPAIRRAMEIVVTLGRIYGAERLVPIQSAQIAGVSYKNLGEAGLSLLKTWAAEGARVRVPATLNPAGVDLDNWKELGFDPTFVQAQRVVIEAYTAMGIQPTCTCTPYLVGNLPRYGDHLAWAESSAVIFANSVLGARTNREGGPSALAAAIVGRTAAYGLHTDQARLANTVIDVRAPLRHEADWAALGYLVGKTIRNGVPYLRLHHPDLAEPVEQGLLSPPILIRLRALGAAMAASGAIALYHIESITPEARAHPVIAPTAQHLTIDTLAPAYQALNTPTDRVDIVSIGCPHATLDEIATIATALRGKRLRTALWITTSRSVKEQATAQGYTATIEAAGGHLVADTCLVVAPMRSFPFRTLATNSAKMAFYAPAHSGLNVRFGPLEQCLAAALTGTWPTKEVL